MPHTPAPWRNFPDTSTPLSAAALIDLEERLAAYAESVAAGGTELGYAQITSNATTTSTTAVDVAGLTTTVTVGTRPIKVIFDCRALRNSNAAGAVVVQINEGATILANVDAGVTASSAGERWGTHREVRLAPSAGAHTYKIMWLVVTGTGTLDAGATTPAFIQVVEV